MDRLTAYTTCRLPFRARYWQRLDPSESGQSINATLMAELYWLGATLYNFIWAFGLLRCWSELSLLENIPKFSRISAAFRSWSSAIICGCAPSTSTRVLHVELAEEISHPLRNRFVFSILKCWQLIDSYLLKDDCSEASLHYGLLLACHMFCKCVA